MFSNVVEKVVLLGLKEGKKTNDERLLLGL
jgi:hypothetical protein